ncbi:DoxX family protein [Pseudonocardia sp. RS11V-5]|uniref:DoxX family protein n=1 Tax=Pseudonocardia terrae TaxID=2905831 RepID=UPI001E62BF06|nr:DoxX family protein [Pseudonocardia terrae]MCE3555356.1 DoxX family protein [Pseudonocardia terrae]
MLTRSLPEPAKHVLILVARLTVSFIMLAHVWQSFFQAGFGTATDQFTNFGIPLAIVATAFTLVVELIGSILIAVGIFVPWAAAGMAFVMYGAIWFVHGANGVFVKNNGFELVALIAGIVLAIAAFGPGRYSLDHLLFDRKRQEDVPAPVDVSSDPTGVPIAPAPAAFAARPAAGPRWDAPHWADEHPQAAPAPRWDADAPAERAPQQQARLSAARPFSLWDDGQAGHAADAPAPRRMPSAYANSSVQPGARHAVHPAAPAVDYVDYADYADYADPHTGPQAHLDASPREQQH